MSATLPRRTAAVTILAVTAASGVALTATSASARPHAKAHTSLSIRADHASVNPGGGDTVRGDLLANNHQNVNRRVTLEGHAKGATGWTALGSHLTGKGGHIDFQVTPTVNTRYQLRFAGNQGQQASRSGVVTVRVRNTTSLTIALGSKAINPGGSDTVNGVLSLAGTPIEGATVKLKGAANGHKLANLGSSTTAADGGVTFSVTPATTSRYVLVFNKTATNNYARSSVATVHVRQPSSLSIRARQNNKKAIEIISGQLRGNGKGLAGRKITLLDRPAGSDVWTSVKATKTQKHGVVAFKVAAPTASEDYALQFAGGPIFNGCQSGVVTVTVG